MEAVWGISDAMTWATVSELGLCTWCTKAVLRREHDCARRLAPMRKLLQDNRDVPAPMVSFFQDARASTAIAMIIATTAIGGQSERSDWCVKDLTGVWEI